METISQVVQVLEAIEKSFSQTYNKIATKEGGSYTINSPHVTPPISSLTLRNM